MNEESSPKIPLDPFETAQQAALARYVEYQQSVREAEKKSFDKGLGARIPQQRDPQTGKLLSLVRRTKKLSRNDACPCGSGQKYKNCCIIK